jgi:uncharacterized MAPEG superfamily protein
MTAVVLAVLVAGLFPMVCAGIAKWGRKDYDNRDPRTWMKTLQGYRARADAAQSNSLEAFPFFAAGVVLALMTGAPAITVAYTAWFFVAMRIIYVGCYLADKASARSLFWALGYGAVIRLFVLAL